jgi:hypothetical protein
MTSSLSRKNAGLGTEKKGMLRLHALHPIKISSSWCAQLRLSLPCSLDCWCHVAKSHLGIPISIVALPTVARPMTLMLRCFL